MRTLSKTLLLGLALALASDWSSAMQEQRQLKVVLAGDVFSNRIAQEGLVRAVPWDDFAAESFPRQDMPVRVEFRADRERQTVVTDAREKRYDPQYARLLLEKSGFYRDAKRLTLIYSTREVEDSVRWLRRYLHRLDERLSVELSRRPPDPDRLARPAPGEGILWVDVEAVSARRPSFVAPRTKLYRVPHLQSK
jgi:hypothetical protein